MLRQPRSTQRRRLIVRDDEGALTRAIVDLASEYGRYGYRRITALLRQQGWHVNHKRVGRIWRRDGLKVPHKQPKRGRLWLNDGSCVHRRPQHRHHVWSYDFVMDRTYDGRVFRMLNGEIFFTLKEAKILIEQWRIHHNTIRPHSSLGYRPPAPQAINPLVMSASATQH